MEIVDQNLPNPTQLNSTQLSQVSICTCIKSHNCFFKKFSDKFLERYFLLFIFFKVFF